MQDEKVDPDDERPSPRFCFVLPAAERYTPESGGAIATVTKELGAALLGTGSEVVVVSPSDGHQPYRVGRVHLLGFGDARGGVARSLARKVRGRLEGRGVLAPRYESEVLRAVDIVGGDVVVIANDPQLAKKLALRHPGKTVVLWLHNLLVGRDAEAFSSLPGNVSLVTVSLAVRQWTARRYGLDEGVFTVIHNGVNVAEFWPSEDYLVPKRPVRVVCHGRIDPNKGQLLAAGAVRRLRDEGLDVTITLMGGIQTFGMPEELVQQYVSSVQTAVRQADGTMTGRIPATDVASALRTFDIACILPLVPDPFPLAGLEAMAAGCAVIAAPLGGVAEMIGDAAVQVTPDEDAVHAALRDLVIDAEELASRKAAAVGQAQQFTWTGAARLLRRLTDRTSADDEHTIT